MKRNNLLDDLGRLPLFALPVADRGKFQGPFIYCRACGRQFTKWNGTASHGMKHVRRNEAEWQFPPGHNVGSSGGRRRYFYVKTTQ